MATNTVPIEIVLQDPNNPIVPDTPGDNPSENTNISVPDTALGTGGYTTKDSNSTSNGIGTIFNGSSAAVSITSVVVLVLSLGAILALLVYRYRKRKKEGIKAITRKERLTAISTSTLALIAAAVLVGQLGIAATNATDTIADDSSNGTTLNTPNKIQIIANRYEDVTIVASTKAVSYATTDTTFGYKIFMSMAGETANLYLDGDTGSQYYFVPTSRIGLSNNSWGYSLDDGVELAMPLASDPLMAQQNTNAVEGEEFIVYYTMKADKEMPFGVYSGEITYDIEGYNGFPSTLTTMQGMTSEICDAVATPNAFKADGVTVEDNVPTTTLTDIRDNKAYTIAKLADGKCWMTQNLDLDLDNQTALTPENTNISASWTPANSTIKFTGTSVSSWSNSRTVPDSADPGELYIYSSGSTSNDDQYTSLADCQAAHPDCSMKNHAGNYYNWSAAVANNNTSSMIEQFSDANTSICPAGWRLPTGRQNGSDSLDGNEIGSLVNLYKILGASSSCGDACTIYDYASNSFNIIRDAPLWMVRSGYITTYGSSVFEYSGGAGYYWSSTSGEFSAYRFYFNSNSSHGISPGTTSGNNGNGSAVRCIAQ